jgi:hypothetical protein
MDLVEQDFDIKFVKDINDVVSKINENLSQFLNYLFYLQETNYNEKFLNDKFNKVIKNEFSNKIKYFQVKQACLKDLKTIFINYSESISKIENDYIKRMKEYCQDLEYMFNNFNFESEPQSLNSSSSSNNRSIINGSFGDEERGSLGILDDYKTFNEDNNKIFNNDDIYKSKEINFKCPICPKGKEEIATTFCDICNQLFCNSCYEKIENLDNNKCEHNIQNIAKMKERNEIGKKLYLNSSIIFIKRIIIKSNYLLNNQSQKLKLIKDNDGNNYKIDYIKKKLFEYPIIGDINNINDSTEIIYLNNINNILVNNLEINNEDINSYNISEIHEDLVSSFKNIFMDEKNEKINSGLGIRYLVKQQEDIDDDDEDNVEEDDITDEKYYKRIKKK